MRRWPNVVLISAKRMRRWPTLSQHWLNVSCLLGTALYCGQCCTHVLDVGSRLWQRQRWEKPPFDTRKKDLLFHNKCSLLWYLCPSHCLLFIYTFFLKKQCKYSTSSVIAVADPGGTQEARPLYFRKNTLKVPKNPGCPPFLQILDPPLDHRLVIF